VPEPYDFFAPPRTGPPPVTAQPVPVDGGDAPEADPYAPPQPPAQWMTAPGGGADLRFGPVAAPDGRFGPVTQALPDSPFGGVTPAVPESRFGGVPSAGSPAQYGPAPVPAPYGPTPAPAPYGFGADPYGAPPQFGPVGAGFAGNGFAGPGYPGGPHSRTHVSRPGTIVAASVMVFVQAALFLLYGLIALVAAFGLTGAGNTLTGIVWIIALFLLGLGGFFLMLGLGILKGRAWAAIVVVVLNSIAVLLSLAGMASGGATPQSPDAAYQAGANLAPVISVAWAAALIILLAVPKSRAWLRN
jgi:hypothetical protein